MKTSWRPGLAITALLAIVGFACVELTGQRIAWFHDVDRDEFRILLAYDGVHDDVKQDGVIFGRGPKGAQQLEKFVASQDVMILDWFFHLERNKLAEMLDSPETGPARRAFAEYTQTVAVSTIGHYRDHQGRIGAVQHIVIPGARRFFAELNAALRESIVAEMNESGGDAPKSRDALLAACESEIDFVALDGHALVFTIPIDRDEYRASKLELFSKLYREASDEGEDGRREFADSLRALGGIVASLATSWSEEPDRLRIVLGDRDRSNLMRVTLRDEYEPNLEADVAKLVPASLDEAVLDNALAQQPPRRATPVADLLAFGPPELVAFALARAADDPNSPHASVASEKLFELAREWNAAGRWPAAPTNLPAGKTHVDQVERFLISATVGAR